MRRHSKQLHNGVYISLSLEFEFQCASCRGHCAFVCYVNRALNSAYENNLNSFFFVCICMCDVDACMHGFILGGGICS